jgi:hypothetical protein
VVSTPTSILRLEKQALHDNTGSWNVNANQVIQGVEDAVAGFLDLSTTGGDTVLTSNNYAADQSRKAYIRIANGQTLGSNVRVASGTARLYFVHNASAAGSFTVQFGGSYDNLLTIPRGYGALILIRSDLSTVFASPLIAVATGLIDPSNYAVLTAKFPIKTEDIGCAVISSTLAATPGSPTSGDRYIVPASGVTGAWVGSEGKLAVYNGSSWDYTAPVAGMIAFDKANHYLIGYDTVWRIAGGTDVLPTGGITYCLFAQAAAPTGWTKQTTHDDKAIRVVSGTPSNGGSVNFSTVFGRTATDSHVLTQAELPSYNLSFTNSAFLTDVAISATGLAVDNSGGSYGTPITVVTALSKTYGATAQNVPTGGSGTGHTHDIDLRVKYVDVLIATRN